jgi:hypothetical protein
MLSARTACVAKSNALEGLERIGYANVTSGTLLSATVRNPQQHRLLPVEAGVEEIDYAIGACFLQHRNRGQPTLRSGSPPCDLAPVLSRPCEANKARISRRQLDLRGELTLAKLEGSAAHCCIPDHPDVPPLTALTINDIPQPPFRSVGASPCGPFRACIDPVPKEWVRSLAIHRQGMTCHLRSSRTERARQSGLGRIDIHFIQIVAAARWVKARKCRSRRS